MSLNITPKWEFTPSKEKVIVSDTEISMAQSSGGGIASAGGSSWGEGNNIFKIDPARGIWLGAAEFASAPLSVSMAGSLVASDLTITGGTIKYGKTTFADVANPGYFISASGLHFGQDANNYFKYTIGGTIELKGAAVSSAILTGLAAGSEIAIQGWTSTLTFVVADYRTVTWSAGGTDTIKLLDGTTYTISAGSTGNMAALTYIYLDIAVSTTALQVTTTAATAVGTGKILIAVAQNNADTAKDAMLQVFGGKGGLSPLVTADNIAANTITANEIATNTITANQLSTALLYAGSITLDTNGLIKGGQTAYKTGTGFFLGYSTDRYKFSIGDDTHYVTWNGTDLTIAGASYTDTGIAGASVTANRVVCMGTDGDEDITPITGIQDAFVDQGNADANYIANNYLQVGKDGASQLFYTYIKFDLTDPPEVIYDLILKMNLYGSSPYDGTISVYRVTSTWQESTITWNNKPTYDATVKWGQPDCSTTGWKEVVNDGVNLFMELYQAWKLGIYPNYGIVLIPSGGSADKIGRFYSHRIANENQPKLASSGMLNETKIEHADITNPYSSTRIVGFAKNSPDEDETLIVQTDGIISGLSSLKPGATYYLGHNGALTLNIDDEDSLGVDKMLIRMGVAISTTQLKIEKPTFSKQLDTITNFINGATQPGFLFVPIPFAANKITLYGYRDGLLTVYCDGSATSAGYEHYRRETTAVGTDYCMVLGDGITMSVRYWTQTGILFTTGWQSASHNSCTVIITAEG